MESLTTHPSDVVTDVDPGSPGMPRKASTKEVISWAMYDFACCAFATTVMAGFFPIFYGKYWHGNVDPSRSTFELGLFNSTAGLIIACLAPFLGAIADRGGNRKRFLLFFAWLGVAFTVGLFFIGKGNYVGAGICFVMAVIGYLGANIFFDSMIVDISAGRSSDKVSALSFGIGYLGGGLLFTLDVLMTLKPELFGLADKAMGVRMSFLSVGVWWFLFSWPLALNVHERRRPGQGLPLSQAISAGLKQLAHTMREIRKLRQVVLFLVAYWLYIDGLNTIVVMATKLGLDIGLPEDGLIKALLMVQFIGFPAAIGFGILGHKIGTRTAIYIGLAAYIFITFWGWRMTTIQEFFGLAAILGLVQGGVQSLSRSFYSRLIPPDKSAEFFGFYNMLGKFATLLGPMLMGLVTLYTGSTRDGVLAIAVLFIAGAIVLSQVKEVRVAV